VPEEFTVSVDNLEFPVHFYTELTPTLNPNVLWGRVRAFYRYENRNFTYFDDETAAYMVSHLAGTPIVGTFVEEANDFAGHNRKNPKDVRLYGCVPGAYNFQWEKQLDEDGVEREYACFDVWVFTYHSEGILIPGKKQSMELDPKSVRGNWETRNGLNYFHFTPGVVLAGLCVLGDAKRPCFEGAAFYNEEEADQYHSFTSYVKIMLGTIFAKKEGEEQGGNIEMPVIKMPLVDPKDMPMLRPRAGLRAGAGTASGAGVTVAMPMWGTPRYECVFDALNPNYNEENNFTIDNFIFAMSEETFEAFEIATCKQKKFSYTVNGEELTYEDITEEPEDFAAKYATLAGEFEQYKVTTEASLSEKDTAYAALQASYEELQSSTVAKEVFETLEATKNELEGKLSAYAKQVEEEVKAKKGALLKSYEADLPKDVFEQISASEEQASYEALEAALALAYAKVARGRGNNFEARFPNQFESKSKLDMLLDKYRK